MLTSGEVDHLLTSTFSAAVSGKCNAQTITASITWSIPVQEDIKVYDAGE